MTATATGGLNEIQIKFRICCLDYSMRGISIQIRHPLPAHRSRCPIPRLNRCGPPLPILLMHIERRHIDTRDSRQRLQKLRPSQMSGQPRVVSIHKALHGLLAFSDDEGIKKETQRLRIERRAGTAGNDDGVHCPAFRCQWLNTSESKDLQYIEIVHLKRNCKGQQGESLQRALCLQAQQLRVRTLVLLRFLFIRQEEALAGRIRPLIHELINDMQA